MRCIRGRRAFDGDGKGKIYCVEGNYPFNAAIGQELHFLAVASMQALQIAGTMGTRGASTTRERHVQLPDLSSPWICARPYPDVRMDMRHHGFRCC